MYNENKEVISDPNVTEAIGKLTCMGRDSLQQISRVSQIREIDLSYALNICRDIVGTTSVIKCTCVGDYVDPYYDYMERNMFLFTDANYSKRILEVERLRVRMRSYSADMVSGDCSAINDLKGRLVVRCSVEDSMYQDISYLSLDRIYYDDKSLTGYVRGYDTVYSGVRNYAIRKRLDDDSNITLYDKFGIVTLCDVGDEYE